MTAERIQSERNLQQFIPKQQNACRICNQQKASQILQMPCNCRMQDQFVHEQCLRTQLQTIFIQNPKKIEHRKKNADIGSELDNTYIFMIKCSLCKQIYQFQAEYQVQCMSPYNQKFKYIACELVCYIVTLLICLGVIAAIVYVLVKFFRQHQDSIFSVVFAFLFLVILIGVVIRVMVQLIYSVRVKWLKKVKFVYPNAQLENRRNQLKNLQPHINNFTEN